MFTLLMLTLALSVTISSLVSIPLYQDIIISFVLAIIIMASGKGKDL